MKPANTDFGGKQFPLVLTTLFIIFAGKSENFVFNTNPQPISVWIYSLCWLGLIVAFAWGAMNGYFSLLIFAQMFALAGKELRGYWRTGLLVICTLLCGFGLLSMLLMIYEKNYIFLF